MTAVLDLEISVVAITGHPHSGACELIMKLSPTRSQTVWMLKFFVGYLYNDTSHTEVKLSQLFSTKSDFARLATTLFTSTHSLRGSLGVLEEWLALGASHEPAAVFRSL